MPALRLGTLAGLLLTLLGSGGCCWHPFRDHCCCPPPNNCCCQPAPCAPCAPQAAYAAPVAPVPAVAAPAPAWNNPNCCR